MHFYSDDSDSDSESSELDANRETSEPQSQVPAEGSTESKSIIDRLFQTLQWGPRGAAIEREQVELILGLLERGNVNPRTSEFLRLSSAKQLSAIQGQFQECISTRTVQGVLHRDLLTPYILRYLQWSLCAPSDGELEHFVSVYEGSLGQARHGKGFAKGKTKHDILVQLWSTALKIPTQRPPIRMRRIFDFDEIVFSDREYCRFLGRIVANLTQAAFVFAYDVEGGQKEGFGAHWSLTEHAVGARVILCDLATLLWARDAKLDWSTHLVWWARHQFDQEDYINVPQGWVLDPWPAALESTKVDSTMHLLDAPKSSDSQMEFSDSDSESEEEQVTTLSNVTGGANIVIENPPFEWEENESDCESLHGTWVDVSADEASSEEEEDIDLNIGSEEDASDEDSEQETEITPTSRSEGSGECREDPIII